MCNKIETTEVLIRWPHEERDMQEECHGLMRADWSYVVANQETPNIVRESQEARGGKKE